MHYCDVIILLFIIVPTLCYAAVIHKDDRQGNIIIRVTAVHSGGCLFYHIIYVENEPWTKDANGVWRIRSVLDDIEMEKEQKVKIRFK